ncbi:MAG: hypothetical protein A2X93_04705 [Deltaproteobacteria bacterium GWC2_56_8]|nr:MAG: hypothetical protein A2X93_04705 [Deltaproteobacteria bacterium GWC2_56_8]
MASVRDMKSPVVNRNGHFAEEERNFEFEGMLAQAVAEAVTFLSKTKATDPTPLDMARRRVGNLVVTARRGFFTVVEKVKELEKVIDGVAGRLDETKKLIEAFPSGRRPGVLYREMDALRRQMSDLLEDKRAAIRELRSSKAALKGYQKSLEDDAELAGVLQRKPEIVR